MDQSLPGLLSWYLVFLFSLVAHEAAHAWAAWRLGDSTARLGGQVSLNPVPHIRREPFGTVVIPVLFYLQSGWMLGWASAPYSVAWATRFPRRHALMALAGPCANLIIVALAFLIMKAGIVAGLFSTTQGIDMEHMVVARQSGAMAVAAQVVSIAFSLNLILLLFNLIPLPPLDGWSVLKLILPEPLLQGHARLTANGIFSLAGLVAAWFLFPKIGWPVMAWAARLIN